MKESDSQFNQFLDTLQRQFLCCYPVREINWDDLPKNITWDEQECVIESTYNHPLNQISPIKNAYQLNFLKVLQQELEQRTDEIHDAVYESYCSVQQRAAVDTTIKYAYKHYLLPGHSSCITLRESKSFVAEGTTGLCSWQASIALANYLLQNLNLVQGRRVLELGSGTGLCGFVVAGHCAAAYTTITDGSIECVRLMRENIKRNFPNASETEDGYFKSVNPNGGQLIVQQLLWNELTEDSEILFDSKPDILLAADVVYDDTIFKDLIHAIDTIFKVQQNNLEMLLAATVRSEHTLQKFLTLLDDYNLESTEIDITAQNHSQFLFWDHSTPIKILSIKRTS